MTAMITKIPPYHQQYGGFFCDKLEKCANFHEKVVTLTLFKVEDRLHLGKTQKKFGFSLDLDNFLTLKNANLFEFSSLNRNFALSLHRDSEKSHP